MKGRIMYGRIKEYKGVLVFIVFLICLFGLTSTNVEAAPI